DDRSGALADGRQIDGGDQWSGGRLQETAGLAVDLEKPPHLLLQLGVPAAGASDVPIPLLRRELADRVQKQLTGFLQVYWHGNTPRWSPIVRIRGPICPDQTKKTDVTRHLAGVRSRRPTRQRAPRD